MAERARFLRLSPSPRERGQFQKGTYMPVYVAEISGRGVIAFDAPDVVDAEARLADRDCCGIFGCVKTKAVLFGTGSLQSTCVRRSQKSQPGRRGARSMTMTMVIQGGARSWFPSLTLHALATRTIATTLTMTIKTTRHRFAVVP